MPPIELELILTDHAYPWLCYCLQAQTHQLSEDCFEYMCPVCYTKVIRAVVDCVSSMCFSVCLSELALYLGCVFLFPYGLGMRLTSECTRMCPRRPKISWGGMAPDPPRVKDCRAAVFSTSTNDIALPRWKKLRMVYLWLSENFC